MIDFCSQLRPPGSQKTIVFLRKNKVFSKKRLSKITSISASILVPTCLHVALENRRFSDFWRFQEAFKISCFFASIFYRFWLRLGLQHGAILGAKTPQNPKKWLLKIRVELPKSGSGYEPAFEDRSRASWPRFWGGQGSIFEDFWMIFGASWLTLAMFSAALAGGASPPQTPPLLTWFSSFLVRSSANFAKKIQEFAEGTAENPRTCRGQSREKNPYERLQENSNHQSFLLLNSLPYRSPPYSKNLGRRYSPQGGFNPPPNGVGVLDTAHGFCQSFLPSSFRILLLGGSCLPPPKSSPSSLGPTPSAAAICGAGASWRLLGRKNRVPRGIQKLIKF